MSDYRIETKCVQAGYTPGNGEPRQIPIIQSTTFKYATSEDMGKLFDLEASGYFYSRLQNPTCDHVAAKIAALEGGSAAMLTGSGQAANFMALFNICEAGSHIVASSSIYGGTFNLIAVTLKKMGIESTFVSPNATDDELDRAFRPNTRAMFGETIANPALTVLDIEKFAQGGASARRSADCGQHLPHARQLPADSLGRGHCDPLDDKVHGRPRRGTRRRHRGQRQFRLDGTRGEVSGALHARRKLPRHHLRREIRQCRGITSPNAPASSCAIWAACSPRRMPSSSIWGWRACMCGCRATARTQWRSRSSSKNSRRWRLSAIRTCRPARTTPAR